ncbi:MAG: peptidylprolyl isomerase [Holophagales bacterium]|nr:peptidylprolyl isomerase [Holophagales bacterium]
MIPTRHLGHLGSSQAYLAWLLLAWIAVVAGADEAPSRSPERGSSPPANHVLATVGDVTITVDRFVHEMARYGTGRPDRFTTVEERRALLDQLIREQAVASTARQQGYAEHPEILALVEQAIVAKFTRDHLDTRLAEASVTDEEIESYYQTHREQYTEAARVRGAVILIAVPRDATAEQVAELERKAEQIRARAIESDTDGFGALARRHSDDRASRPLGGSIGWIRRTGRPLKWGEEVVDTLFSLKQPGEIGPIARSDEGFWVVQLLERDEPRLRSLESVRAGIERLLLRARRALLREQFYREIEHALQPEINSELLEDLSVPAAGPPPVPGS